MLKQLRIQDFILVEKIEVPFSQGLNVVTGETGSGKSVLLKALRLLAGARADSSLIRKGSDECVIEALFSLSPSSLAYSFLQEEKIAISGTELSIKRTISKNNKSAGFIQGVCCKNSQLKTLASLLFEIVDQHAAASLFSEEKQLASIDQYGNLFSLLSNYKERFLLLQKLKKKKALLLANSDEIQAKLLWYKEQKRELVEANLSSLEEKELEKEYKTFSHAKELSCGALDIASILSSDEAGVLQQVRLAHRKLSALASLDPSLEEPCSHLFSASLELQELSAFLERYSLKIEVDPYRMQEVTERLDVYAKLQKRYRKTTDELILHLNDLYKQLETIDFSDTDIDSLENEIIETEKDVSLLASKLTEKRAIAAKSFCQEVAKSLHSLQMPHAELIFFLEKKDFSPSGQDNLKIELKANLGELFAPLASSASGGEMARVTLAVKRILSSTDSQKLMLFDEIDSGIGGKTASTVADELYNIAKNHQILLITHFPQVAKRADHHIRVFKQTQNERTFTFLQVLDESTKSQELRRMVGEELLV